MNLGKYFFWSEFRFGWGISWNLSNILSWQNRSQGSHYRPCHLIFKLNLIQIESS